MAQNSNPREKEKEKLEFLKREEIRTMAKDVAKLREREAQKEREKVAALSPEEREKPPRPLAPEKAPEKVEKVLLDTLIPKKPPPKPSSIIKILVRIGVVLVSLSLIGFVYWFFAVRQPEEITLPPAGEEEEEQEKEEEEKPEIIIPAPLISVTETRTPEITKIAEIPEMFNQLMKEEIPEESLIQIVFKNLEEKQVATLEDLASAYQVEVPSGFYQKIEENYTLLTFSQKEGDRVVLVTKVKDKEGLIDIFKTWEDKIVKEGIWISGRKIPTLVSYFRTASVQGVGIRYLTISKQDLGICYAQFDDYFLFSNSFQGMERAIEAIRAQELEKKVGQLFIIGFEGTTITSELEEIFKKYRPGGVLLLSQNIENAEQLKSLIAGLQALSLEETGLPLLVAADQEGGVISRIGFLQEKTAQSEIKSLEQAYQVGLNRGTELKDLGVNLNLAPLLDLADEEDFIFSRSFQKLATETGLLAKSLILGQKAAGILTAMKHFPGYGGVISHPEDELAVLEALPEISQFEKAAEANPELIMTANVVYKTFDSLLPFTFSSQAIQFLKNNTNPGILVVSDDLAQDSLLNNFNLKETVTKPIEAGVDILIFSGWDIETTQGLEAFYQAFKNGEVSKTQVEAALSRIIQLKQSLL